MTRRGENGRKDGTGSGAARLVRLARAVLPGIALLGLAACGSATTAFVRATGPVPLDEAGVESGPGEASGDATGEAVVAIVRPGEPRDPEAASARTRRAAETFAYVPRRVSCEEIARVARAAASRSGLETGLLVGVMRVESAFAANAISSATAVGLTQVLPWIGEKLACGDLFDPAANVACGAKVLSRWLDRFDGNLVSALSAYNAGHGMPTRAREERRIPKNFQYVEDVLRNRSRFLRRGCAAWESRAGR